MISLEVFLRLLDLGGTFVFAISGAVAAVNRRLDIFGILVLSFVAGTVGGITRDLLIGAVPPAALKNESYLLTTVIAGLLTFFFYKGIDRLRAPVLWFDAAGLSFFAVAGTEKALEFGLNPLMAALLGMVTGIGGGMVRDLLLIEIPQVLRSDLYAVAALAGAAMVVLGQMLGLPRPFGTGRGPPVLRPALHGDSPRLVSAGRASLGAPTGRDPGRSGKEGKGTALKR